MTSIGMQDPKQTIQATQKPAHIAVGHRIAKNIVFKILSRLQLGCIVLKDGEHTYNFGESNEGKVIAQIVVHDAAFYREVVSNGTIGAGEAYMKGYWTCPDLVELVRVIVLNMDVLDTIDNKKFWWQTSLMKFMHRRNLNKPSGSRRNIAAHYDLSNEFFATFLDPTMMYSAAIFRSEEDSLHQASLNKLKHICERLQLQETDHLLEIGSGWGSMAIYAAKNYGCRVTTTTLSQQQFDFTLQRIREEGLEDKIELLLQDYRDLNGHYDKLVSIEMIEAVGHQFYSEYFSRCSAMLKKDGLMLLQGITISDQRYESAIRNVDFIQRYIFPGGCLPSNAVIAQQIAKATDMHIVGLEDITRDYARTIAHWRLRFLQRLADIQAQGFGTEFLRMWDYYLAYCQGGFLERVIHTAQFLIAKPGFRALPVIQLRSNSVNINGDGKNM